MLSWMIITYFICLGLGWGLLLLDYIIIRMERRSMSEPWANDVVVIGGASAVLSPIINWGEIILNSNPVRCLCFGHKVSLVPGKNYV